MIINKQILILIPLVLSTFTHLWNAGAKLYIKLKRYHDAKSDIEYLLYLEPENQDALKVKELIESRISYQKLVSAFPIYS